MHPLCYSSLFQRQSCAIIYRGADQLFRTPTLCSLLCQRQSHAIMNQGGEKVGSFIFILLLAFPQTVLCLKKVRKLGSTRPQHCRVWCPNDPALHLKTKNSDLSTLCLAVTSPLFKRQPSILSLILSFTLYIKFYTKTNCRKQSSKPTNAFFFKS